MTTETPKTKRKHKLPLTAVLTYLIVVTLVATGVSLSAYVSTASGGDEARVAKFDVQQAGVTTFNLSNAISPSETGVSNTNTVIVYNNSEVTVRCNLAVNNLTGNLPLTFDFAFVSGTSSYDLAPGETGKYNVLIQWPQDKTNASYMGKVDQLQLVLVTEQID